MSKKSLPRIHALALLLLLSLLPQFTFASTPPDKMLEATTQDMIHALQDRHQAIQQDHRVLYSLIENILLPHIDIITSSRMVLGKYWRQASKKQKLRFIHAFRNLLVRFYSSALAEYLSDHKINSNFITFLPLRESLQQKRLTVHAEVHPPKGEKVAVSYRMRNSRKGWRGYDVAVAGISIISTYRTSFASEIKQKGLERFIASIEKHNQALLHAVEQRAAD
ncbi:MAG: ABC transporter substrate-binding protein [Gammaproteobacteria bacterium]|nr:ABC transporter substrate-binding protein [Gammaproteobacteria bacterium]